jgi:dipeptidyl aminopeptidase/acylaminoacyl peptidase
MSIQEKALPLPLIISIVLNILLIMLSVFLYRYQSSIHSPLGDTGTESKSRPLQKYSYESLRNAKWKSNQIKFGPVLEKTEEYETRMFYYEVEGKKVSGLAHIPTKSGPHPVLIMIRGYVDLEIYEPGVGSSPAARYFAANGYITLAPDFLGYGESDKSPIEPFADRLISYPTVLQLLSDVKVLNNSFEKSSIDTSAEEDQIGIWAHSNGGQIALSVLEIAGQNYPTVLWAPVSKPFPYSVLYFTDEFEDNGKYLRNIIAEFEDDYNIELFTLTNYVEWIQAPIELHQGGKDDAVPLKWSDQLYTLLKSKEKEIEYFVYENSDHNMRPDWDTAARRSLTFFDTHLKK